MIKYTGYGNCAGLLAQLGLLKVASLSFFSSSSSFSTSFLFFDTGL